MDFLQWGGGDCIASGSAIFFGSAHRIRSETWSEIGFWAAVNAAGA